jgi:hypothetical protein
MWSNPTAVYRLIGCHKYMVVLGCEILPNKGKNYISHNTPRDLTHQVQDIVSAMTKAWKRTSRRLHHT